MGKQSSSINASLEGHTEIVELLLANNADVNVKMNLGGTALMLASSGGHIEIVKSLITHNADVNKKRTMD